jgi:hypothetical protein
VDRGHTPVARPSDDLVAVGLQPQGPLLGQIVDELHRQNIGRNATTLKRMGYVSRPVARLAIAVMGVAAACSSGGDGPTLTRLQAGTPCGLRWAEAEMVGTVPGERKEVSGFVASAEHLNVAWMVRDSGNPAVLYSFELDDGGKVTSREFPVEGATNGDWEDVAYTSAGGDGHLWILDNINRSTSPKTIWEVAEPAFGTGGPATAKLLASYRWDYPDGNHDTETLFALDRHFVVVSKTTPSRAYVFDDPLDAARLNIPRLLGEVPGPKLVLGSTTGDERLLLTSSTRTDTVYVAEPARGWTNTAPVFELKMPAAQREAGDFFPYDGCDIVLLDEREHIWLLRNQGTEHP